MTGEQKQQIYRLRKKKVSFGDIADRLGIPKNTVKTFCWRNGLSDTEIENPKSTPKVSRGYNGFCKMCGVVLESDKLSSRPKVFCSDKCRFMWWRFNPDKMNHKSLKTDICPECGKEFTYYPSRPKRFCSHPCYIRHRYRREDSHENVG